MGKAPQGKNGKQQGSAARLVRRRIFLKEWLKLLGKTQTQFAEHSGLSETNISLIANAERRYNQDFLEKAALFLAIEPSELLHPPPEPSVWAAWHALDADGRRTVQDVLMAIRARKG